MLVVGRMHQGVEGVKQNALLREGEGARGLVEEGVLDFLCLI
jgi:hypothetical protein